MGDGTTRALCFRASADEVRWIDSAASTRGLSRAEFLRECVFLALTVDLRDAVEPLAQLAPAEAPDGGGAEGEEGVNVGNWKWLGEGGAPVDGDDADEGVTGAGHVEGGEPAADDDGVW